MTKVTNRADGPRGFNVLDADGKMVEQVLLAPGESRDDLDLTHSGHETLYGLVRSRELVIDEVSSDLAPGADAAEKLAADAAAAKAAKAEAAAQKQAEADAAAEKLKPAARAAKQD